MPGVANPTPEEIAKNDQMFQDILESVKDMQDFFNAYCSTGEEQGQSITPGRIPAPIARLIESFTGEEGQAVIIAMLYLNWRTALDNGATKADFVAALSGDKEWW